MDRARLADFPEVLTVPEAAHVLRLSRNGAYAAAQAGDLPVIRMGRRLLVPKAALQRMLSNGTPIDHEGVEHESALAAA